MLFWLVSLGTTVFAKLVQINIFPSRGPTNCQAKYLLSTIRTAPICTECNSIATSFGDNENHIQSLCFQLLNNPLSLSFFLSFSFFLCLSVYLSLSLYIYTYTYLLTYLLTYSMEQSPS